MTEHESSGNRWEPDQSDAADEAAPLEAASAESIPAELPGAFGIADSLPIAERDEEPVTSRSRSRSWLTGPRGAIALTAAATFVVGSAVGLGISHNANQTTGQVTGQGDSAQPPALSQGFRDHDGEDRQRPSYQDQEDTQQIPPASPGSTS